MLFSKRRSYQFLIQPLERRTMLSDTPASPRPDTLGATFDKTERQDLLSRLTNISSNAKSNLTSKLNTGAGAFDGALLSLFQGEPQTFFYAPSDVPNDVNFIKNNNINFADNQSNADDVTDSRLFPQQSDASSFTVQLPNSIDWTDGTKSSNPEFLHALNRQAFWVDLAWSSAITGDSKYANELSYELASWSSQYTTLGTPASWSKSDQSGWLLDSSIRAENWVFTYFTMVDNAGFSAAENSLFLYKIAQQADFLYSNALSTTDFGSNRDISLAKGLMYLAEAFPEFDDAPKWETAARNLIFKCMDTQLYADGSQTEESPGYTSNVADDLLGARYLDELNGNTWPSAYVTKLSNAIDSVWQMASPNGARPAIGDTYRTTDWPLFLEADIVQGTTRWPQVKPRIQDVWMFGPSTMSADLGKPVTPATLGSRGQTYALEDAGYYIMRSDNSMSATQITFDAGPTGGSAHGHFDQLGFELFGSGQPLISEPGAYKYDSSANRQYVISTQASNTLNADGANLSDIEGANNPAINVSQWVTGSDSSQITASDGGYSYLAGSPTVARSMWYDMDGTILLVDWANGTATHNWQESFNLQTDGDNNNVSVNATTLTAKTRYSSGGNVQIQGITTTGETAVKGPLTFVTNTASGSYTSPAYRFTLNQSGKFVAFVTLITTYNGTTAPGTTASLINSPTAGGTLKVMLTKGGVSQEVDFTPPVSQHLDAHATSRGTYNDIAYDKKGNLDLVYADRDTGDLMFAIRDTDGNWSVPSQVDPPASSSPDGGYQYLSLAVDNNGNPGVAYFDGWDGNLKYAFLDPNSHAWQVQTVDAKGSTGLYPSLAFSRNNGPVISYYNRTPGDLDLAQSSGTGFSITPIDTGGDVGRFSSITLDPNRPTVTKWAIGYEDTSNGNYKYAIQGLFSGGTQVSGYTNYTVDNLSIAGGYLSLAFYDSGTSDSKRYKAAMSYYDAGNSALRYAYSTDSGLTWVAQTVASKNIQGLYTNLFFDSSGQPNIFYYNRSANEEVYAILHKGTWAFTNLRAGGRETHVSVSSDGTIAYSDLDESLGTLTVYEI